MAPRAAGTPEGGGGRKGGDGRKDAGKMVSGVDDDSMLLTLMEPPVEGHGPLSVWILS